MVYSKLANRISFNGRPYAHRGLWSPESVPENSSGAFERAASKGLGIELDVRLSRDFVPMVFHDRNLERMTGIAADVSDYNAVELQTIQLGETNELIPTLSSLLDVWPVDLPILCEMKVETTDDPVRFARIIEDLVTPVKHQFAVMSFDAQTIAAFSDHLQRGRVIHPEASREGVRLETELRHIDPERIEFIACHTSDAEPVHEWAQTAGLPNLIWTVRSPATINHLKSISSGLIFEAIDPDLLRSPSRNI